MVPFISHVMLSWSLSEYEAAQNAEVLFSDLTANELHELFCYAGGSLRLLLMLDVEKIKSFLDDKIAKVQNPKLLLSGLTGSGSETFINALVQLKPPAVANNTSVPVSEYESMRLVNIYGLQFVKAAGEAPDKQQFCSGMDI